MKVSRRTVPGPPPRTDHQPCVSSSCGPAPAVQARHHARAGGPERPPEVRLRATAVEPAAGLPGGVGQAHQPQHEGRDPAGDHQQELLPGRDGRHPLQTGRDGNSCHTMGTKTPEEKRSGSG